MKLEKYISIFLLLFAIGFNLWLYRAEPTAKVDPNDNTFQYALVHRTNEIWDQALNSKHYALLVDHWVPNWAQGYNLPYYYSHIPQIAIVALHRFLCLYPVPCTLFTFYHWVIYLLLCLFPLSIFLAIRVLGLSWIAAGFSALIASQISADGLYGLEPASYLWRGYGLSSQLFAIIWLPLAIAYSFRGKILPAILFLTLATAGHLGLGIIACMSIAVVAFHQWKKLPFIFGGMFLLLAYWIVPILIHGDYHNISVWDPIWKFDSYGYRDVLKNLFNGDIFDFGRLPILTALVFVGLFSSLSFRPPPAQRPSEGSRNLLTKNWIPDQVRDDKYNFALLFAFWILLYFGRATWGGLVDLIPGMSEFHLSRFIVGVQIAGLFLIAIAMESILSFLSSRPPSRDPSLKHWTPDQVRGDNKGFSHIFIYLSISLLLIFLTFPQTISYSKHNDFLIARANVDYEKNYEDINVLISKLHALSSTRPGRVYAGRGGTWGKELKIAETPLYMHLSTFGIPTVLWLPQTWSPNSDTEQYFREDHEEDYALYNVRYIVTPIDLSKNQIQSFWKLLETGKTWRLYSVETEGYIATGVKPAIVSVDKTTFTNVVRLWIQSDAPSQRLFPEITFDKNYPVNTGLPNFRMIDEVTYKVPAGTAHNLFSEVPKYISDLSNLSTLSDVEVSDSTFKITVDVPQPCPECLVILKQTYHPSWTVTVNGEPSTALSVFPFYTAVKLETPGTHEVIFSYQPSMLKKTLMVIGLFTFLGIFFQKLVWGKYKN